MADINKYNGVHIFGAGLSGLIAARMLLDRNPIILEKQSSLPNNHQALLRFRTSAVGDATNIPFRKVNVSKHVVSDPGSNPIRDAIVYSRKVSGMVHARSILDLSPSIRYIAPSDLISKLSATASILFGIDFEDWSHNLVRHHSPIISTIPVPVMMKLFKWPDIPNFNRRPGWNINIKLKKELCSSMHATIYSAKQSDLWYRASINDSLFIIEGSGEIPPEDDEGGINHEIEVSFDALNHFGLNFETDVESVSSYRSYYQKISDLSTKERESVKRFVMWLSAEHQIYSLGRYATWRPKLLLDDIVNDVRVISRLIDGEANYNDVIGKE